MKKTISVFVALVATFMLSVNMYSTPKGVDPGSYCKYNDKTGECDKECNGWVCYGVDESCSWVN